MDNNTIGEFWVAFAGGKLTSTVSLRTRDNAPTISVTLSGIMDLDSAFITNVLLAAIEIKPRKPTSILIDVKDFLFVEGTFINHHAVECLIGLAVFAMGQDTRLVIIVDNEYVRDVLTDVLRRHRRFSRTSIYSSFEFTKEELS
ncbi:STAS domain-containing protein [uncultured Gammaproteobacteria bacterium]